MTSWVRRALRGLQTVLPESSGGLVILLYHLVEAGTESPVDLPSDVFRAQMEELRDTVHILPLAEAGTWLEDPHTLGETAVVVTFDDAYASFIDAAFPVLEALGIPTTLYIPAGFVEGTSPAPIAGADLPAASWSDLRTVLATGLVTPGSHTVTHPDLRRLPHDEAENEVIRSRQLLEERLGTVVETFAYPRALAPGWLRETVRSHYRTAVVAGGIRVRPDSRWDPHSLPRIPIRRDGPRQLAPLMRSPIWLEEWLASRLRPLRPDRGGAAR